MDLWLCGAQVDAEWGGGAPAATQDWAGRPNAGVPRVEKYDTRPYEPEDDDEYRTDAPKQDAGAAAPGGVRAGLCNICDTLSMLLHRT